MPARRQTKTLPSAPVKPTSVYLGRLKEILVRVEQEPSDALVRRLNELADAHVDWDEIRNAERLRFMLGDEFVFALPKLRDEHDLAHYLAALVEMSRVAPDLSFSIDLMGDLMGDGSGIGLRRGRFARDDSAIKAEISQLASSRPSYERAFTRVEVALPGWAARRAQLEQALRRARGRRWLASCPRWQLETAGAELRVIAELDGRLDNVIGVLRTVEKALEGVELTRSFLDPGLGATVRLTGEQRLERQLDTRFEIHLLVSDLAVGAARPEFGVQWVEEPEFEEPVPAPDSLSFPEAAALLAGRSLAIKLGKHLYAHLGPDGAFRFQDTDPAAEADAADERAHGGRYSPHPIAVSADGALAFFRPSRQQAFLRDLRNNVDKPLNAEICSRLYPCCFVADELVALYNQPLGEGELGDCQLVASSLARPTRNLALAALDKLVLVPTRGVAVYLAKRDGKSVFGEIALADFSQNEQRLPKAVEKPRSENLVALPDGRVLALLEVYDSKTGKVTSELFALAEGKAVFMHSLPTIDLVLRATAEYGLVMLMGEPDTYLSDFVRLDWQSGACTSLLGGLSAISTRGRDLSVEEAGEGWLVSRRVRTLDPATRGGSDLYSYAFIGEGSAVCVEVTETVAFSHYTTAAKREAAVDRGTLAVLRVAAAEQGACARLVLAEAGRTSAELQFRCPISIEDTRLNVSFLK